MADGTLGREYGDGAVICRQGDLGEHMFVIQAGRAEVFREEGGGEILVGELSRGDVFGEMALFDREPRSATVRAKGPIRVLSLDKRAFLRQVHEDASLAYRILQSMSSRIRGLDEELALLRAVSTRIFMVKYLFIVSPDHPELHEQLVNDFAGDREVQVVMDRRLGQRRKRLAPHDSERRRPTDRRGDLEGWTVKLTQPYRSGRPRFAGRNRE